ncbi:MAG: hypothetical protein IKC72_04550 [Clostridia bacterium]|nr:hypothetical protein [Clostridia bacterium]
MKNTIRLLLVVLSLLLVFTLGACDETPDTGSGEGNGETETIDRTDPSAGEYQIRFFLGPNSVIHYYNEGETIVPPETLPPYETSRSSYVFESWEGVEFKTVTGNAAYHAKYKEVLNYYTATFVVAGVEKKVQTICGDYPKMPAISEFGLGDFVQFVCWDKENKAFTEDVTFTGITTKLFDAETFLAAYQYGLLIYPSKLTENDNKTTVTALALNVLMMEENQNPQSAIADRIVEHFVAFTTKDQAPAFDASCNWNYSPHTASIALAKATPSVWNKIPADIKLRLDTMMRAFAMLESFATSDYNNYGTGPSMKGNYGKGWNPNYRLANIPVMVFATHYFGNGDMDAGAEYVNDFLKGFDEAAYTDMVNTFQKYGWRRASVCWTSEGRTSTDGKNIKGLSAKELMVHGGQAVGEDTPTDSDLLVALGTGVGVGNGGKDYLYKGYALNEPAGIIRSLLMHNYGTGDLTKTNEQASTFLEVKSDHWYDKDGDGVKDRVAWILDESSSPYEGQYGMMKEFASGNRSSTGYCSHDFVLTVTLIYNAKILGIYDLATDTYTDRNGVSLREAIIVGNEDFLYKNEIGYQGYATGSYGESTKSHSEKNEGKASYFSLKALWRNVMKPELESTLAE